MKPRYFLIGLLILGMASCTSKTIYGKPKDLIPKDSMGFLIHDLLLANAAKNVKNKKFRRKLNYHPLVYEKYKIDSTRFQKSNLYYTSMVDEYEDILNQVITSYEAEKLRLIQLEKLKDSIYKDSIKKLREKNPDRSKTIKQYKDEDVKKAIQ